MINRLKSLTTGLYVSLLGIVLALLVLPSLGRCDFQVVEGALSNLQAKVSKSTLSNGMRVIFYRRPNAPVFAGAVAVRVGGTDEASGQGGIAHLLEHMAFKGTPAIGTRDYDKEKHLLAELEDIAKDRIAISQLPPDQLSKWKSIEAELKELWITDAFTRDYEKAGATGLNATTDAEITKYFVNLPNDEFERWCYMESQRLVNPVFRQFYQERDVVLEERRMRYDDDPDGKLHELLLSSIFRVHPYRNPVIGYRFDVERLTASDIAAFHKKYYVPSQIAIGLVGDLLPEKALPILEKYFGAIPPGAAPERPWAVEPEQKGERRVSMLDRASPQLAIAYHKPNYPHPDDARITVMLETLAGGKVSPLYSQLVIKKKMALDIDQSEGPGTAYPNAILFSIVPKSPYTNEALIREFDKIVVKFIETGPTDEDLLVAKRRLAMDYLKELNSNNSLAVSFATSEILYGNWQAPFDWFKEALAVNKEDTKQVAAKYLKASNRTIVQLENLSAPK